MAKKKQKNKSPMFNKEERAYFNSVLLKKLQKDKTRYRVEAT